MKPFVKRLNFAPFQNEEPIAIQLDGESDKLASGSAVHPEMRQWVADNPPPSNVMRLLITALGAADGYGPNVNGDGFFERHLTESPRDVYLGPQPYDKPMHRTFVDFSQLYKHHKNKPHNHAYGQIPHTIYNDGMRRVEVVADIYANDSDNSRVVNDIQNNIFPGVSMGFRCFVAGTMIQTERGAVPIEEIRVGDMVYTHRGRLRMVTETFQNEPPDELIALRATEDYTTTRVTPNHEYYAIRRKDITTKSDRLSHAKRQKAQPKWMCVEHLKKGDYVLELTGEPEAGPIDYEIDEGTAYLLGLYIGDGSVYDANRYGKKVRSVSIECDAVHPAIHEKIVSICREKHWNFSVTFTNSNTVRVTIRESKFGTLARDLFGDGSKEKYIASSVYGWTDSEKFALLGGYLDADGHFNGSGRITSVNENLMQQTKQLAWSAGLPVALHRDVIGNTKGGFAGTSDYGCVLSLGKAIMATLAPYTCKVPKEYKFGNPATSNNFIKEIDGKRYIAKRIRKVERVPNFVQTVYNFAVEEDESYVAEGNIVHNCVPGDVCSICLNYDKPFPDRRHYCDHLRHHMLEYHSSGRQIFAINHNGYFFDLSIVTRPADRIAWGMKRIQVPVGAEVSPEMQKAAGAEAGYVKYASEIAEEDGTQEWVAEEEARQKEAAEKGADDKAADHDKRIPGKVQEIIQENPDPEFAGSGVELLFFTDIPLDKGLLNLLGRQYELPEALATLIGVGIIPNAQEFQRLVLVSHGYDEFADLLDEEGIVFDPGSEVEPDSTLDVTEHAMNPKLAQALVQEGVADQRSYYAPFMAKRAAQIKEAITAEEFFEKFPIRESPQPRKKVPEDLKQRLIQEGVDRSAVGKYYRKHPNPVMNDGRYVSEKPEGATTVGGANPLIPLGVLAALFGGAKFFQGLTRRGPLSKLVMDNPLAAAGIFGGTAAASQMIAKGGLPEKQSAVISPKTAKFMEDYMLHILGGLGLGYGMAGRSQRKRELGIQPNIVESAYEKRPLIGSGLTALGIGGGLKLLSRKLASVDIKPKLAAELDAFESMIGINDQLLFEYPPTYVDKMARLSLSRSAKRIKKC